MELHRNSRLQDGYHYLAGNEHDQIQAARGDGSGSFGVKVQVQGIQGRPFVVLNGQNKSSQPAYPDVFFMDQPGQEYVSTMNGQGLSIQRPLIDYRSMRQIQVPPSEVQLSNTPSSPLLNYQRHPALLRPYDPKSNNLDLNDSPSHIKTKSNSDLNQFSTNTLPVYASNLVMVKKAKIPLPGTEKGQTKDNLDSGQSSVESVPCRQSHIICRLSVPYSGEDNGHSSSRVSRVRHRNQVDPQERKRSQSVGAPSSGHSSRTSPVSAGGQEMGDGPAPPESPIGCVSRNDSLPKLRTRVNIYEADIKTLTAAKFEGQRNEWMSPRLGRVNYRTDRGNPTRGQQNGENSSPERAQVKS